MDLEVQVFELDSDMVEHPHVEVGVDPGFKLIGGGAQVIYTPDQPGCLLTASYPNDDLTKWIVKARDSMTPSANVVKAFAIGLKDPDNEFEVKLFKNTVPKQPDQHIRGSVTITDADYTLTCGGARTIPINDNAGNFLTESTAKDSNTWEASCKDHEVEERATLEIFAIGLKLNSPILKLTNKLFLSGFSRDESHPSKVVSVPKAWNLTGGGAEIAYGSEPGNLLTASFPLMDISDPTNPIQTWNVAGKDHNITSPAKIEAIAIGVKTVLIPHFHPN
ncbi:hypothetical protein [Bacillus sp. BD59S]|uniref:hypothetical protein n=1 Tax=Bacillus sp. BD59S TaxID=2499213 RepID=UPI00117E0982|nr:hypothetical protein [Bacillus sp. BD59S]QDQ03758.1 hypothetical protein EKQ63_00865 [Bacillus sp. BD59S]